MRRQPSLLAHRGLGQSFDLTRIRSDTCTASRMLPPRHSFLENTIASIQEAFRLGADVVELDVHPTTDGQFAVFHDWTLECRTNGTGVIRAHTMSRKTLQSCYLRYALLGWSGYVPEPCRHSILLVPTNVGPWLWGWPHRFQHRMAGANTVFFAVAPYYGGGFSSGIDGEAMLRLLPDGYVGGISTDQIYTLSRLLHRNISVR
jgi:Glycerophosphoryl diester phosphodiesterase family